MSEAQKDNRIKNKIMTTENFGEHLTIDGYNGSRNKLNDREIVFNCLDKLPGLLQMNKLADASLHFAPDGIGKDPGGWSGFVIIAESHISIHTFPDRGFVSADVYTCKNGMDVKFILNYFKETFELTDIEYHLIKRGTKYPVENIRR